MGALCNENGLGSFSTHSVYFVNNFFIRVRAMSSTIVANGARLKVNDYVNSLMILYILCLNTNLLHQLRWLLFCGLCGFAFVVCVSFVDKMGVVYGATLQQSVVSIGKRRQGCNIWKF